MRKELVENAKESKQKQASVSEIYDNIQQVFTNMEMNNFHHLPNSVCLKELDIFPKKKVLQGLYLNNLLSLSLLVRGISFSKLIFPCILGHL